MTATSDVKPEPNHTAPSGPLLTALTTEHFVLQSMAATATSEAGSRCSLYLMTLSSSLVAFGFTAQASRHAFMLFAAAVLPTLFLLGCFTVERLVDTTITNINCLRRIARIRRYYAQLSAQGGYYFPGTGDEAQDSIHMIGTRASRGRLWFTMASIIAVVNAAVAGSGIALALTAATVPTAGAVPTGVLVAGICAGAAVRYQRRRLAIAFPA